MNKLLARQIKRKLGKDFQITEELKVLFETISMSYEHYERDRKLLERAMEVSSEELRESFGKLAIQKELESKNDELEQFVSVASHDLKAPLRTINSFSNLLKRELSKANLSPNAQEYLDFISQATKGMNDLIHNLLEYARVGTNKSEIEEVDLTNVVMLVEKNLHSLLIENKAKIEYSNLPKLTAIPHQMIQLFQNLIGNAIKFKKENVSPVVKVHCKEKDCSYIFSVEDNGIGISKNGLPKVFEAFTRLEGGKLYPGTGLGLSICKSIVENMKGKIWVESEKGIGTTFLFSIPKQGMIKKEATEKAYLDIQR